MKVLHFYRTYLPDTVGGVQNAIYQLCEGTCKLGVHNKVLTLSNSPEKQPFRLDNHEVIQARSLFEISSTNFSIDVFGKFSQMAEEADIIHYHYPWPFMDLVYLTRGQQKKSIVTYHSDIVKQRQLLKIYKGLMRVFLGRVDKIIATSPNYMDSSPALNEYQHKTSVIPYGLNEKTYPTPNTDLIRKWQNLFGEKFFLFVGVLRYYKGLDFLVEAAKHSKTPIIIAGSGPCEPQLKEQCARENIDNIHFLGQVSNEEKISLLKACHAFVFPSHLRSEAFGISLLEASMMGKPMITCEIESGISYVNKNNLTGLSVPPQNPEALGAAMRTLAEDPEKSRVFGEKARERYLSLFQAEKMSKAYYQEYKELLAKD